MFIDVAAMLPKVGAVLITALCVWVFISTAWQAEGKKAPDYRGILDTWKQRLAKSTQALPVVSTVKTRLASHRNDAVIATALASSALPEMPAAAFAELPPTMAPRMSPFPSADIAETKVEKAATGMRDQAGPEPSALQTLTPEPLTAGVYSFQAELPLFSSNLREDPTPAREASYVQMADGYSNAGEFRTSQDSLQVIESFQDDSFRMEY